MRQTELLEIYRRLGKTPPADIVPVEAPSKYRSRVKMVDNITFASTGEARMYQILKLREQAGAISGLELQPWYILHDGFTDAAGVKHRPIRYRADFRYTEQGVTVVADFKGKILPAFVDKSKLFRARYPHLRLEIWTRETLKTAL